MEKLRNNVRSKKSTTRPDGGACRKHPKHQQTPGVCSMCLNEKLAKLSNTSGRTSTTMGSSPSTTSSLSSYYSSTDTSSCSSPPVEARNRFADREGADEKIGNGNPVANWLLGGGGGGRGGESNSYVLKKSRSVANYFPRRARSIKESSEEKKGRRFWAKLLRPIGKRKEDQSTATLVHSRTVRNY